MKCQFELAHEKSTNLTLETGHLTLQPAAISAVIGWKFTSDATNQSVDAVLEFGRRRGNANRPCDATVTKVHTNGGIGRE